MEREVSVVQLGVGNVGSTLLRQILEHGDATADRTGVRIAPIAIADVSGLLFDPNGLPERTLWSVLEATSDGGLLDTLPQTLPLSQVSEALRSDLILADVTASPKTEPTLRAALDVGAGVVLANKIPLAQPWSQARSLLEHPNLRYEVTVGAGLPVIDTLHYLLDTGDRVTTIEGCLSGTLGYLCAELEKGVGYSEAVANARELGYTEPNPRDDLSGKDVARKALILGRTAGWPLEESDLEIEALYPEEMDTLDADEFLATASALDEDYAARVKEAAARGKVLRYVARVRPDGGTVGLLEVDRDSPLGALRGPANYIALHTVRYDEVPLVLSGPGAGREVTAAGVFGDILDLACGRMK